jgi:hypothetical protein
MTGGHGGPQSPLPCLASWPRLLGAATMPGSRASGYSDAGSLCPRGEEEKLMGPGLGVILRILSTLGWPVAQWLEFWLWVLPLRFDPRVISS